MCVGERERETDRQTDREKEREREGGWGRNGLTHKQIDNVSVFSLGYFLTEMHKLFIKILQTLRRMLSHVFMQFVFFMFNFLLS